MTDFITTRAKDVAIHREFIKVQYDHNLVEGCDKSVRGISVTINNTYQIEENCGKYTIGMENTYFIEVLYLSAKEAGKITGAKFLPPTDDEMQAAALNG